MSEQGIFRIETDPNTKGNNIRCLKWSHNRHTTVVVTYVHTNHTLSDVHKIN